MSGHLEDCPPAPMKSAYNGLYCCLIGRIMSENIGGAAMDAEIIALFQELPADDKKVVIELARALANK